MNLPDRARPRLTLIRRTPFARLVARLGSAVVWRTLHPTDRAPFVESPRPPPARRLYYEAEDGWRAPLFRIDPRPDASGEPVLIAHGLTAGPDLYRYGRESLVAALRDAGFAVYLWTHRADRYAEAPEGAGSRLVAEHIVERDLPAALAVAAAHAGFSRVHVVGHGFGGLLALGAAGRRDVHLASVVALGAPLVLPAVRADGAALAALLSLLPARTPLPLRTVARLGAPLVGRVILDLAIRSPSARLRGALVYGADDPPVALLRMVRDWARTGTPTLYGGAIELCEGIASADVPLLVVTGEDDPICPPAAGERALGRWGHPDRAALRVAGSHLDLVLGARAPAEVFAPVVDWLSDRRRASWSQ